MCEDIENELLNFNLHIYLNMSVNIENELLNFNLPYKIDNK